MPKKKENTFLMVSLEETKARKVAQVLSNDTARKILDQLSKKEATESELAQELSLPISTVHYNLRQLMDTGLVVADEFHYSAKGKEVLHYSLANKYIIIAPKFTRRLPSGIKTILPTVLISALAGIAIWKKFGTFSVQRFVAEAQGLRMEAAIATKDAVPSSVDAGTGLVASQFNPAVWFVAGALFAIVIFLIIDTVYRRLISSD